MKLAKSLSNSNDSLLFKRFLILCAILLILIVGQGTAVSAQSPIPNQQLDGINQLVAQAEDAGTVRVLVELALPFFPEGDLGDIQAVQSQQQGIDGLQESVLDQLADTNTAVVATFQYVPYLALEVDAASLEALAGLPQVANIVEDVPVPPSLSSSTSIIGADQAWGAGYTGAGQAVAILDTGVDSGHAAFTTGGSRIVSEACYSTTSASYASTTVCPGGAESSTSAGSGIDCTAVVGAANSKAQSDCEHGTHVASIAAGDNGSSIVGVAPDANIIAIQVFSLFNSASYCGGYSNCALTFTSDQILGLERVYELRNSFNISSVNMSLGGGQNFIACDGDGRKAAIDNLRAVGIATVIASGNNGYKDSMSAPACISSAISVGASDDSDNIASFSNISPFTDLVAPGSNIDAAIPGGEGTKHGTSMAAPHVAGAWALFKQAVPSASVDETLAAFQSGAVLVDDNRSSGIETGLARIHVNNAINSYKSGLNVAVSVSESFVLPSDMVQFTIDVTNGTSTAASQVVVTAPVPSTLALKSGSLSGDASVGGGTITWTTGQTLNPGQSLSRTVTFDVNNNATAGEVLFTAMADSPSMDEARQGTAVLTISEVVGCGFSDGFESGVLSSAWETAVTEEGRVRVLTSLPNSGSYSVVLDDSVAGSAKSEAGIVLTADLTGQAEVELAFSWYDLGDEYDADYDGVFIREQPGDAWVKAYDFSGNNGTAYQDGTVDLLAIASENGLTLTDRFQIKFGFYDNFPFDPNSVTSGDGYAIDDVSVTCIPRGLAVTQQIDNENPMPGDAMTIQIIVTNNETTTATNSVISFFMAQGLSMNGSVIVDEGTAVSGTTPPLLAEGITIAPGQEVIITIPTILDDELPGGTVLENVITVSSNEFGSPPPTMQTIVVGQSGFQTFIPLVIR